MKNFVVVYHNDYKIEYKKVVPKIKENVINIGIFSEYSDYKGKEHIEHLSSNIKKYNGYTINYLIVGQNIPRYTEHEFFNYIKF